MTFAARLMAIFRAACQRRQERLYTRARLREAAEKRRKAAAMIKAVRREI